MSDEPESETPESGDVETLPRGVTRMVEAALNSPAPSPEAETAAQERALTAYQEALLAPRPLHADPWRPGSASRLARFLRRLRGG